MTDPDRPLLPLTGVQKAMIGIAMVAMGAGMSINFVVVAPLARKAGLTEIQVAGILTLSAAVYALLIPTWGRLADRFGRKRVMVFSLAAMGLTNMIFVFALSAALAGVLTGLTAFFTLVFVRLWFGLLSPGLQPAAMAAMTDATTPLDRAGGLGMLGACMSIGSILGPAGATVLAPFGALMPIWGTIAFNLIVALVLAVVLPRNRPNAPPHSRCATRASSRTCFSCSPISSESESYSRRSAGSSKIATSLWTQPAALLAKPSCFILGLPSPASLRA